MDLDCCCCCNPFLFATTATRATPATPATTATTRTTATVAIPSYLFEQACFRKSVRPARIVTGRSFISNLWLAVVVAVVVVAVVVAVVAAVVAVVAVVVVSHSRTAMQRTTLTSIAVI